MTLVTRKPLKYDALGGTGILSRLNNWDTKVQFILLTRT